MSHNKPYPAYKDSGVEWIGRVPEHWAVKRIEHMLLRIALTCPQKADYAALVRATRALATGAAAAPCSASARRCKA